jgi:beta-glucanase (GH16 family)
MAEQNAAARQPVFGAFAGWRALVIAFLLGGLVACGGGGGSAEAGSASAVAPAASETPIPPTTTSGVPAGYQLVWSDEFDQPGLPDVTRWDYDTDRNRLGWYNNERQYYARGRAENAVVSGGQLLITARKESLSSAADWGGQAYTSARLLTRGKAAWTYGFFEVRAKLPCGVGTWPAIWTLGTGGRWPQDGEIDIMEQVGSNPSRVFGTVHTQAGYAGNSRSGGIQITDACTAFHNYQMTWTADAIEFAVDGLVYHRYPNPRSGVAAWPFDAPQYLLLNIAIGGDLGGPVDDRIFPVTMAIEHVRVYRKTP